MLRRAALLLIALLVAVAFAAPAAGAGLWLRPVAGEVVRPFRPPLTRYGAGHLGVDFAAAPGTPVRAAGLGKVEFAGMVANTRHVVVLHPGNLRTSYSFLATIRVHTGQIVGRGTVVGTTGGRGLNHDGAVLHFALRIGAIFIDPMVLFASPDLAARVHLAPEPENRFGGTGPGAAFRPRLRAAPDRGRGR
jgi:murein DD-endopeptidase MepM/ murein hydrolase activator NlpD